jgi:hypothetical protein
MRSQVLSGLAAAIPVAVLALIPVPARADAIECQIPFSFVVHGKTLPPGRYRFSDESQALLVRGYSNGAVSLTNRLESATENEAKAVFEKDGDEYILKEAWMGGGVGRELLRPRTDGERRKSARDGQVEGGRELVTVPAL